LYSKPGQGGDADHEVRDLRAELLQAEAAHFAKAKGGFISAEREPTTNTAKRQLENGDGEEEDPEAKRRRILEETRDIDADSDDAGEEDSSEDDRFD
jgi:protein CWC15